jgi:thiamine-phosphate pyrophosphorylase
MNPLPSRFYPVVPDATWVGRLVHAGARMVQLRIKEADEEEIRRQARQAKAVCHSQGASLILNDHWRIAIELGIAMIHLGQEDLETADLPAIRAAGLRLGVSTHSEEELERALSTDPFYVALGPIYPTTLKVMPWKPQGLERIGHWKRCIGDRPLVAIGGITLERAAGCVAAGADCVSVVSDVLSHQEPEQRAQAWLSLLDPPRAAA